jgi:hypothetical protein
MDATLHTIIAAQYIQDRLAEATGERAARDVKPRRWFSVRPKREVAADRSRPVASPQAPATST